MILQADDKIRNTTLLCVTFKKANLDKIPFQSRKIAKNKPVIPDHHISSRFLVRTAGNLGADFNTGNNIIYNFWRTKISCYSHDFSKIPGVNNHDEG